MEEGVKYKTLGELAAAYKSGELDKNDPLWLDNDTASVYVSDANGESVTPPVFTMHPGIILEQALDLLGIPHEGV